jgi:hypothetical protein
MIDKKPIHIINIVALRSPKAAYRYEECEYCAFHNVEPGICDECEDASEFEPDEEEDSMNHEHYAEAA